MKLKFLNGDDGSKSGKMGEGLYNIYMEEWEWKFMEWYDDFVFKIFKFFISIIFVVLFF